MKKYLLIILITLSYTSIFAQTQIENGDFEGAWEDILGTDEPEEWSSLKSADALAAFAPEVIFQETTDPHGGTYCLRLTCMSTIAPGVIANGMCTNGRVHADLDPDLGNVFTDPGSPEWELEMNGDTPDSLVGWYKFAPQGGDKAKFEMILHDNTAPGILPETGSSSHWIARARYDITAAAANWTRFSVAFEYFNANAPVYGLLVINAGDSTIAVEDSEMIIDDIELIYNSSSASIEKENQVWENNLQYSINRNENNLQVNLSYVNNAAISVYTIAGQEIYQAGINDNYSEHEINVSNGIYIYRIVTGDRIISGKIQM